MFFLFVQFIGVILVNKIIQILGAEFYNTSFVLCIVCSPIQAKSPSITIYPTLFLLLVSLPVSNYHAVVCVHVVCVCCLSLLFSFFLNISIPTTDHPPLKAASLLSTLLVS